MTFEFGIFDSFDRGPWSAAETIESRLRLAEEADARGFDHYHVTEHHGTELSVVPSPNLFLAALSQRTRRMRMGALVYVLPEYEPIRLAEEVAVVDQLTHGRIDVGVGSGVSPHELAYFGVAGDEARGRYERALASLAEAWTTGVLRNPEHPGRPEAELSVLPVQRPYPPLWYASSNPRTAEWAGANAVHFLGRWNGGELVSAAGAYWAAWRANRDAPGRLNGHVGGVPRVGMTTSILVAASDAEARDRFLSAQAFYAARVVKLWHDHGNHGFDAAFDGERMLEQGTAVVGTAASVRDRLVDQIEHADVNMIEAQLYQGDMGHEEGLASLRAFAAIMPEIRAAAAAVAAREGRASIA